MPQFLSAKRLAQAIDRVGHSRAKANLFDFLIVKRTLAIKGEPSVAIAQSEPAFIAALEELGSTNSTAAGGPYINVFAITDTLSGYRTAKYKSNGTNSTISNNPWQPIVELGPIKPRKASLRAGYEGALETLFLKSSAGDAKPNLDELAIWYHRASDIEALTPGAADATAKMVRLRELFVGAVALTPAEIGHLFEATPAQLEEADLVSDLADPDLYLPNVLTASAALPSVMTGNCSLDLVNALSAKPFVILTGPSGTGKTRAALKMVEGLQNSVGEAIKGSLFQLVPVGPDWTSPKRLLGYRTPFGSTRVKADGAETNESYEITETIRLILRASHPNATGVPYFLIFDEMNLSHVERYFAPFLSLMEAANILDEDEAAPLIDPQSLATISELLVLEDPSSAEAESARLLVENNRNLRFPSNLFFIGTVNVDETTYIFSPKVLDRAHVLEIGAERPSSYLSGAGASELGGVVAIEIALTMLQIGIDDREGQRHEVSNPARILDRLEGDIAFSPAHIATIQTTTARALDGCYDLLEPVGFPFGYRTVKEVFVFIYTWLRGRSLQGAGTDELMTTWPDALDKALLQKVLPKIHGNKRHLGDSLRATAAFLGGGHSETTPAAKYSLALGANVSVKPDGALALAGGAALPLSKQKLEAMHNKLSATGYVSSVS